MRRVIVIGSGGAGKSTLARQIGERTGLPVIHLDAHYWRAGWVATPRDEWVRTVERMTAGEAWVMDGNYGGTLDLRLAAADTVVFLDLPRTVALWGAIRRRLTHRGGRVRPDMAAGCPEQVGWEFIRWIWRYPRDRRPGVLRKLRAVEHRKRVVILRSRADVRRFVASLAPTNDLPRS